MNFAPGETTKVVRLELANDATPEGFESFFLLLDSQSATATVGKSAGRVAIIDNDTVVATPTLFARDTVVDERDGTATIPVVMGGPKGQSSNNTVTVDYATHNTGAKAGSDYTAASGTLSFAPGETIKNVVVDITDDTATEPRERFGLTLSNPQNATIADANAAVLIGANDATPVAQPSVSMSNVAVSEADGYVDMVLSLNAPGQTAASVRAITGNDTAGYGTDYSAYSSFVNFAPGETTKVVRLQLRDDSTPEGLESFVLYLDNATGVTVATPATHISIVDDDSGVTVYSYGISDDMYTVAATSDVIVENPDGGTDLVLSSATYTLPANVENLTLTGTNSINGTGNGSSNQLTGNGGANKLNGQGGNDALDGAGGNDTLTGGKGTDVVTGGTGTDTFVLSSLSGSDTVTDFSGVDDSFAVSQAAIPIGNGDTTVDGAATRSAADGFSTNAELVVFTSDITGDITTAAAAAKIGTATSAYTIGDNRLFVVDNGTETGIFRFHAAAADAGVSAAELTLVALVSYDASTPSTSVPDYTFVA